MLSHRCSFFCLWISMQLSGRLIGQFTPKANVHTFPLAGGAIYSVSFEAIGCCDWCFLLTADSWRNNKTLDVNINCIFLSIDVWQLDYFSKLVSHPWVVFPSAQWCGKKIVPAWKASQVLWIISSNWVMISERDVVEFFCLFFYWTFWAPQFNLEKSNINHRGKKFFLE